MPSLLFETQCFQFTTGVVEKLLYCSLYSAEHDDIVLFHSNHDESLFIDSILTAVRVGVANSLLFFSDIVTISSQPFFKKIGVF